MTVAVFAEPRQRPVTIVTPVGLRMSWTGWNGSSWDLTHGPGAILGVNYRGTEMPDDVHEFVTESPSVDGDFYRGSRVRAREIFWPLLVRDPSFWATMRPGLPGSWAVQAPGGQVRTMRCRWVSGGDMSIPSDPTRFGWGVYEVNLKPHDDPYWSGTPIVRSWSPGTPVDFIDAAGSPPFHISPGNLLATATMSNPGDVDAYPLWRVDGPTTTVVVGVDGRVVEVPFVVADGESLTVDTRPAAQTATLSDGTDVTADLGEVDFAPVSPGAVVPLSLTMTGTGSVTATLTPRYFRAFG